MLIGTGTRGLRLNCKRGREIDRPDQTRPDQASDALPVRLPSPKTSFFPNDWGKMTGRAHHSVARVLLLGALNLGKGGRWKGGRRGGRPLSGRRRLVVLVLKVRGRDKQPPSFQAPPSVRDSRLHSGVGRAAAGTAHAASLVRSEGGRSSPASKIDKRGMGDLPCLALPCLLCPCCCMSLCLSCYYF